MRRLLALLVVLTLSGASLHAAIALVADTGAQSPDNNGVTTAAIDTTGATLLVAMTCYDFNGSNGAPSDSEGNTWVNLNGQNIDDLTIALPWYVENPTTDASHTFSITGTGNYATIMVMAFSGTVLTSVFDQENSAASISSASLAAGSITPTENNELIISGMCGNATQTTLSVNESMTREQHFPSGATAKPGAMAYKIQTTATAINPTWTQDSASHLGSFVSSFRASAATVVPKLLLLGVQ